VEELDAGRPLLAQDLDLGLPPVVDGLVQAELLDPRRLLPAVGDPLAGAAEVIADRPSETPRIRAVWDCDWPRCCKTSIVTICSLVSLAKVVPPSGPWMSVASMGCAWLACRWMPVRRSY